MSQFWHGIQNVVVVGLGVTGLSVVRHLQQLPHELNIRVNDSRATPPGVDELPEDLECHVGAWQQDWLLNADLLVVNPGIALATPVLVAAKQAGVKIVGDIELFAWAVADMKNPPHVVAITGSNGKSTVTDLTGVLANAAGMKAYIGGNIGVPALDLLNQAADLYVLELSSFQLETTDNLHLDAAAFLNFTEDHMDRYDDLQGYLSAKQRIFKHANAAVANRDDVATYPDQSLLLERKTFGTDAADYGLIKDSDGLYLAKDGAQLIDVKKLSLVGLHNYTNVLVVFALLESLGIAYQELLCDPHSDFSNALCQYQGLSHRCQLVVASHGVRWINDSKATNVASTQAALAGLDVEGCLHLLVGGDGKGADFSALKPLLSHYDLQLHCFGQDGETLAQLDPKARTWQTMDQAMAYIAAQVRAGDVVLLSPACASLDQYKNFMARGDAFIALAKHYAH